MSIVLTEDRDAVRHVILNRPEKRNAMNQELLRALAEALLEAADDESVHCVLLRGEGPVFSAGVDLVELASFGGQPGAPAPVQERVPPVRQPLRNDAQAGRLPDPSHVRRRSARGRARMRSADRLQRLQARPAGGEIRHHPRRRRILAAAGRRRARSRQGADHDRRPDRRRRGSPHRSGQPRGGARASSTRRPRP